VSTLVKSMYLDSVFGVATELEAAGTSLENPYVYDSAARELKKMAEQGLVKITSEELRRGPSDRLIDRISFMRLR
jgi:hypothetical protein